MLFCCKSSSELISHFESMMMVRFIRQGLKFIQPMSLVCTLVLNYIVHRPILSQRVSIKAITAAVLRIPIRAGSFVAHFNDVAEKRKFFHGVLTIRTARTIAIRSLSRILVLFLFVCLDLFSAWIYDLDCSIKIVCHCNLFYLF